MGCGVRGGIRGGYDPSHCEDQNQYQEGLPYARSMILHSPISE